MKYNHKKIESKWQEVWEKNEKLWAAEDFSEKPKQYILIEFPYPSGEGLHVGHVRSYSALDALARKKRMEGNNVLYPIGWDAFGLPTENYAIKNGVHPREATDKNIKNYRRQIKSLGLSFDWKREIDTTDPNYYKWTQWIFLKFFEKGLAYQAEIPINWCPKCKIGLANEEAIGGVCERCGAPAEKRSVKQWLLKITAYADRLIEDLDKVDYLDKIKTQQINWIGRSYGTNADFKIKSSDQKITVFTTRIDTIFGVTALILAPENKILRELEEKITNWPEVESYINESVKKSDIERTNEQKERVGVEVKGIKVINPLSQEEVAVWVADYVIATYGGGAVMMVPAHDRRDWDFAKNYGIAIKEVVSGGDISKEPYIEYGRIVNSGEFNGIDSQEAIEKITQWLADNKLGGKTINYKLRDWIFSRQHYWGEPIPIIHCAECGAVPVSENDLPVELPYIKKYQPTGTGESPLAAIEEWVSVKCPKCKGSAKRETDTMPNWAGSSWYFLRYTDPKNNDIFADSKKLEYWLMVDLYNGGMEHTTLHLLYSRFWHKFLYDLKLVPTPEPYARRRPHGMVLAEDNQKMSKSRDNVLNPDDIIEAQGADSLRIYEMFMGPFDQAINWNTNGLIGCRRFLDRVWDIFNRPEKFGSTDKDFEIKVHQLIKRISEDLEAMKFNTAISAFMEFINFWSEKDRTLSKKDAEIFLKLLAPSAPHICEELWLALGNKESIHSEPWPEYVVALAEEGEYDLIIQINGKMRDKIRISKKLERPEIEKLTMARDAVKKYTDGKEVKKIIFIPNRLINIVVS